MRSFESWILSYLLNSMWQIPLLFVAGWSAARALRNAGAAAEHRVWVIVLLLQSLLPACSALSWEWLRSLFAWGSNTHRAGETHVSVVMGAGTGLGSLHLPAELLTIIAIAYGTVTVYFAARFVWGWMRLSVMRREAEEVVLRGQAALYWARCSVVRVRGVGSGPPPSRARSIR